MRAASSPSPAPGPGRWTPTSVAIVLLGTFVIVSGAIGLIVGLILPSMGAAREAAAKQQSATALASIGTALRAYAADYAGALPPDDSAIMSQLVPRYLSKAPMIGPPGTTEPSWRFVPPGNLNQLAEPGTKILAFETPGHWKRAGGHLLYADGTVKWIDGLRFDELVQPFITPRQP